MCKPVVTMAKKNSLRPQEAEQEPNSITGPASDIMMCCSEPNIVLTQRRFS